MAIPPISPLVRTSPTFKEDLDAFFLTEFPATVEAFNTEIERINGTFDASFSTTSATSILVGTGTKTMTVEAGKSFAEGQNILVYASGEVDQYMIGRVTAYNRITGELSFAAIVFSGSGTYGAWAISVSPKASGGDSMRMLPTSANTTTTVDDSAAMFVCTGTFSLTLGATGDLMPGWYAEVYNAGSGTVTIQTTGGELIDGVASFICYPGEVRRIVVISGAFVSFVLRPMSVVFTSSTTFLRPPGYASVSFEAVNTGKAGDIWLKDPIGSESGSFSPFHGRVSVWSETELAPIRGGDGGAYKAGTLSAAEVGASCPVVVGDDSYVVSSALAASRSVVTEAGGTGSTGVGASATKSGAGGGGVETASAGVMNWNFADSAGWVRGTGWTVTGGQAVATNVTTGTIKQTFSTVVGATYFAECQFVKSGTYAANNFIDLKLGTATASIDLGNPSGFSHLGVSFVATNTLTDVSIEGRSATAKNGTVEFLRVNRVLTGKAGGTSTGAGAGGSGSQAVDNVNSGGAPGGGGGAAFKGSYASSKLGGTGYVRLTGGL